ncbi:hypothetical protein BJY16_005975 [Actinoplanes octamycinicus]|uniref:Uncharacterized protein n=1 Tax=Actinoplanes octamycinicus TaxID=135948 RepID=A0A7W7MA40_9ACTN|nr:hypothetical protein [Actinoplanes octamycinicus]MBB4742516.1 hypothetical protein [Actinoplanes octamycinicus]GIE60854.1 hypothetical protein Aoc01nite_62560 [Actinoplanes octamycinicus]
MRTLEDLRETLDRHAGDTPADGRLLPDVRGRAARLRRRRTITRGVALGAAVAVAAGVSPFVLRSPSPDPAPAAGRTVTRTPAQTSIALADGSPFMILNRESTATGQHVTVRNIGDVQAKHPGEAGLNPGGEVLAFEPGAFDPETLRKGTPVTIGAHQGWYVPQLHVGAENSNFDGSWVGWRDETGMWVLVGTLGPSKRDDLVAVARDVRIVEASDAIAPIRLGWVPPGLKIQWASGNPSKTGGFGASFKLGYDGEKGPDLSYFPRRDAVTALALQVGSQSPDWLNYQHELDGQKPEKINGAEVWYLPRPNGLFDSPEPGADMIVRFGGCVATLHVRDRAQITEADLDRMLQNATLGTCDDAEDWQPLLD